VKGAFHLAPFCLSGFCQAKDAMVPFGIIQAALPSKHLKMILLLDMAIGTAPKNRINEQDDFPLTLMEKGPIFHFSHGGMPRSCLYF